MKFRATLWAAVVLAAVSISPRAIADDKKADDKPDPATKININGLADFYFMFNMNHPPNGAFAGGRAFDVKNDQFAFSLFEVNVNKGTSAAFPVGFTATITLGKTADLVHFSEPGTANSYKYLQQIFGTYLIPGAKGITIDFGKFVTSHGYEVIESSANDHYSRSLLFLYAIPLYHMGLRANIPITDKLTGQLHLVNGWNNVEDDNGGKSIGATLNWKPTGTTNVILCYMGGDEGGQMVNGVNGGAAFITADPRILNTQVFDLVIIVNPTSKLKLGLNADYASASKPGQAGGTWSGWALYGRYQINPKAAAALRGEVFQDTKGLRTGVKQNLSEITATFEYALNEHMLSRIEFRHDHAGSKFFPTSYLGSKDQDTLTFGQVFKF